MRVKEPSKLESAIAYLVSELPGGLTKTKLVKLLYLADRQAVKERGTPITGIQYQRYYYGPYSEDIQRAIEEMRGYEILEVHGISMLGRSYYKYYPGDTPRFDKLNLSPADQEVLDHIIEEYGSLPLEDLLDKVYNTPEFKVTKFGETIDLERG